MIITDEDEDSSEGLFPDELVEFFKETWPNKNFGVFAIGIIPFDSDCYNQNNGAYARKVYDIVEQTNGFMNSICANDYTEGLERMGWISRRKLLNSFTLHSEPLPETIVIETVPDMENKSFILFGKTLTFDQTPPEGTHILISYTKKASDK